MEEWTMNCKIGAQNALKVAIFILKIEKFYGEGAVETNKGTDYWSVEWDITQHIGITT